jgi:pimeloyl-ACP methyl ester carboxylesterase
MGAMNQGIVWPDEFCTELVRQGYYVIRYDHRDTGQSSTVYFQLTPYGLNDLAQDAACVLDGYGIAKAHVVGLSMGGYVAQLLALNHPQRVLSLSLLMTSPDPEVYMAATMGRDTHQYRLPPPSPRYLEYVAKTQRTLPISPNEAIQLAVEGWRVCNGDGIPWDEAAMYRLQERMWARARNPLAAINHAFAVAQSPSWTARLHEITAPTLVIHGKRDPCLPVAHGMALAEAIPGARLIIVPEMGHMLPPSLSGRMAQDMSEHLRSEPEAA